MTGRNHDVGHPLPLDCASLLAADAAACLAAVSALLSLSDILWLGSESIKVVFTGVRFVELDDSGVVKSDVEKFDDGVMTVDIGVVCVLVAAAVISVGVVAVSFVVIGVIVVVAGVAVVDVVVVDVVNAANGIVVVVNSVVVVDFDVVVVGLVVLMATISSSAKKR